MGALFGVEVGEPCVALSTIVGAEETWAVAVHGRQGCWVAFSIAGCVGEDTTGGMAVCALVPGASAVPVPPNGMFVGRGAVPVGVAVFVTSGTDVAITWAVSVTAGTVVPLV